MGFIAVVDSTDVVGVNEGHVHLRLDISEVSCDVGADVADVISRAACLLMKRL